MAAGPLAGILLALILKPFAPRLAKISLLLSVFNLLPVRGLDGGSILRLIYAATFNTEKVIVPNVIGGIVAILTLVAGMLSLGEKQPNIPLLGLAAFLIFKQFILAGDTD
ncbi:hypothetical protein SDC9_169345 [bioreactor metagenome]|uniref:Peptidase M50 domain-containing protein n=1 Tax=bioreactor metagenome TaxID=1076179 RepID=A0A645GDR2_9ZZZZ